jgi:hypothetical protein
MSNKAYFEIVSVGTQTKILGISTLYDLCQSVTFPLLELLCRNYIPLPTVKLNMRCFQDVGFKVFSWNYCFSWCADAVFSLFVPPIYMCQALQKNSQPRLHPHSLFFMHKQNNGLISNYATAHYQLRVLQVYCEERHDDRIIICKGCKSSCDLF